MRHIFVSYPREEADFARIIDAKIREFSFPTRLDMSLSAGDDWRFEIDESIRHALAIVVIMSPDTLLSHYVNYEWAFAIGSEVPVVVVLRELQPDQLHPRLRESECVDFSNPANLPWEELRTLLRKLADAQHEFTVRVPRDAPPVVRDVARAFDSVNASERQAALNNLPSMDHPSVIEILAGAVHHPIREVRFEAACQLADKHQDARALPTLIEAMRWRHRRVESWMFIGIGSPAVPALIGALNDKELDRRDFVFPILGRIRGPAAVDVLLTNLHSPDPMNRAAAAFAVASSDDSVALSALREAKQDPISRVRDAVACGLREYGAEAVPDLMEMLTDSDMNVRHRVVVSLGHICESKPLPTAIEFLAPRLIDALLSVLDDEYDQVRYYAADALKKLCDPRCIPGLIAALRLPNVSARAISETLLAFGEPTLPILREALNDPNEIIRSIAVKVIAALGYSADEPLLAHMTRDENPFVRLAAVDAITSKQYDSQLILQALIERLKDSEEDVAIGAIRQLRQIRNASTVPHLIECLAIEPLARPAAAVLQFLDTREARNALKNWDNRSGDSRKN